MICHGECGVFNPKLLEAFRIIEGQIRQLYSNESSNPFA